MKKICFLLVALMCSMAAYPFGVYIFADMEGCSGVTNSEQVAGGEGALRMAEDINVCVAACFEAGATRVVVRDGHGSGKNVDPAKIDPRAELIQGPTPGVRYRNLEGCEAIILLGYHAMSLTPNAILAHSYSSKHNQAMYINGREVGEIGIDALIAGEHGVPVILVQGADDACREAEAWIPEVVTCQVKRSITTQSGKCLSLKRSHKLLARKTKTALAKRTQIPLVRTVYPVTLRTERVPKGSVRTHHPDYVRDPNPRFSERTADRVEEALYGKPKRK